MLDAMRPALAAAASPATSAAAAAAAVPTRMAFLYFPNGAFPAGWVPKQAGANYELPFSLTPLEKLKNELLIFTGFDKAQSHGGDGHYAKTGNFLTGLRVVKTTGKDMSCGSASIDQVVAQHHGQLTPLPSLELGCEPTTTGVDDIVGYTRLYGSYISWRSPTSPVPREIHPRAAYARLFGEKDENGHPVRPAKAEDDRSLLDMALDDANDLRRQVGRDDKAKLDEYLDSVRAIERRIDGATHRKKSDVPLPPAPPAGLPHDVREHVRLMLDLMVLAFWTDSTRVSTFMFANDVSNRNFSNIIEGVSGAHHQISHHSNNPDLIRQYQLINRWHVAQFAYLLERLNGIRETDGQSLLHHSMLMFGSSMGDGNRHDPAHLPILFAGRGGGTIAPGRHVVLPDKTPLCNLYVSMLDRMNVPVKHFGDSAGRLQELEG
jgi:hypothetical protein